MAKKKATKKKAAKKKASKKKTSKPVQQPNLHPNPKGTPEAAKKAVKRRRGIKKNKAKTGRKQAPGVETCAVLAALGDNQVVDARIIELYTTGHTVREIAEELQLGAEGQDIVRTRIQTIRRKWEKHNLENYSEAIMMVEMRSMKVLQLALDGYEASRGDDVTETVTTSDENGITHTRQIKTPAAGNPQFLAVAHKCINQMGQMQGVFDQRAGHQHANTEVRSGIIEVIVRSHDEAEQIAEAKRLQQMTYRELQTELLDQSGNSVLVASADREFTESQKGGRTHDSCNRPIKPKPNK